ncbi:efflux RND transporter periplasmic adaptor subunit [Rhodobacter sp. SY28-1]|uniref:efflux RND transporter periplasmic adaptor subunit n=1 Tax=Rhodobacter sp. SY28-1 TaxID=2562317 RepID=UPI0014852314|nr:efflux RND transporter periplasmic adaptor subunit [Rhodobacter sp. SY28-1]
MKVIPQLAIVALVGAVAVPLSAWLVPGTRPWLDQIGLLQPLAAAGLVPAGQSEEARGPGGANPGAGGVPVVASAFRIESLKDVVSAIGSARGAQAVELSFEVTGRLQAVAVAPGSRVAAGDVIAELEAETAQLAVERGRLVLEDARRTAERLAQLSASGASTELQRQEAELSLRTAELALQSAERDLSNHRLLAPIAGYVGLVEAQVGDLVSSSTPITRIEDRSSLILEFRVPERLAAMVAVGDAVQATAISTPGEVIEGRIVAVDNRIDEASRTLRVQATIGNADDRLRAGMAFQITLTFTGEEHPAVDPLAIQWGADGAFVWVVRDAKAARQPIRILQRNAETVLVEAEFQPSDLVVTEGVQALRPGADVTVTAPES